MVDKLLELFRLLAAVDVDGIEHLAADTNDRKVLVLCLHDRRVNITRDQEDSVEPGKVVDHEGRRRDVGPVVFEVIWPQIVAVVDLRRGLDDLNAGKGDRQPAKILMDPVLNCLEHRTFNQWPVLLGVSVQVSRDVRYNCGHV